MKRLGLKLKDKLQQVNTRKVFNAILKSPYRSDRAIAKKLGISQPTVTRVRTYLTNRRILTYAAIPDFEKTGLGLISLTEHPFTQEKDDLKELKSTPGVILIWQTFLRKSKGVYYVVAVHAGFKEYIDFIRFHNGLSLDVAQTSDIKYIGFAGLTI